MPTAIRISLSSWFIGKLGPATLGSVMLKHALMMAFWFVALIVADRLAWGGVVTASVMLEVRIALQAAFSDIVITL